MVYAEVLYDVAAIRKIHGFYLKGSASRILPVFFLCLFGTALDKKKSQADFTCDFRNY